MTTPTQPKTKTCVWHGSNAGEDRCWNCGLPQSAHAAQPVATDRCALPRPESPAQPPAAPPRDRAEAEAQGYTVDPTCYPWCAYKGPRFKPTDWRIVATDNEAQLASDLAASRKSEARLLAACKRSLNWLSSHQGDGAHAAYNEARAAIAQAEGRQ